MEVSEKGQFTVGALKEGKIVPTQIKKRSFTEVNFTIIGFVGVFSVFDQWSKVMSMFGFFFLKDVYTVASEW